MERLSLAMNASPRMRLIARRPPRRQDGIYDGINYGSARHPLHRIGRRHIDDPQLHALVSLPAVDPERADDMEATAAVLEEGLAELLPGSPERDGVDCGPVARLQPHAHMRLADLVGVGDGVAG